MQLKMAAQVLEILRTRLVKKEIFKKTLKFMIELDYFVKELVVRE